MTTTIILCSIVLYFSLLLLISWYTSRNANQQSYFNGNKQSAWYLVAFGLIGDSLSGVTFISPMDGKGPNDLNIESLVQRVRQDQPKEIIMALSATMEGDTTIFYINKKLTEFNIKVSTISRGVSFGGELEYVDEVTLGRSILSRVNYQQSQ